MKVLDFALAASVLVISSSANAALIERLGGLAFYDDDANLTWLADANYAATSGYAAANANGLYLKTNYINANGSMGWQAATDWVAGLTVDGVGGWRLPTSVDAGNDGITYTNLYQGVDFGYNVSVHSEMSNMFYNVLGNSAEYDINGVAQGCGYASTCLANTGPFSNFGSRTLSSTDYVLSSYTAWGFDMMIGQRGIYDKYLSGRAWAVQSGDVSAVPVPAAVWLFGSGLTGLVGLARRKR